jgi:hypothetical protein
MPPQRRHEVLIILEKSLQRMEKDWGKDWESTGLYSSIQVVCRWLFGGMVSNF